MRVRYSQHLLPVTAAVLHVVYTGSTTTVVPVHIRHHLQLTATEPTYRMEPSWAPWCALHATWYYRYCYTVHVHGLWSKDINSTHWWMRVEKGTRKSSYQQQDKLQNKVIFETTAHKQHWTITLQNTSTRARPDDKNVMSPFHNHLTPMQLWIGDKFICLLC